jgi:hypothetical protein
MSREPKEISSKETCPCGSGLRYSRCCKKKGFKWTRDSDGAVGKSIPMSDELREIMLDVRDEFKRIFRREPVGDEFVFPIVYVQSSSDWNESLMDLMDRADIDPVIRYATMKTRRIVTSENAKFLSQAELDEWNAAVEEYYEWEAAGFPQIAPLAYESALEELEEEFDRLPYIFGMFLQRASFRHMKSTVPGKAQIQRDVSFYYATKSLKTLRAVDTLLDKHLGEDALALTRTIFENYLHIVYAIEKRDLHDAWVRAKMGLETGTHAFKARKDGTPNRGVIVETATGQAVQAQVRTLDMATASSVPADRKLWIELYETLSEYIHPHPKHILNYLGEEGFDPKLRHFELDGRVLSRIMVLMNFDALLKLKRHPRLPRRDVQVFLNACRTKLDRLFTALGEDASNEKLAAILHERIQLLGRSNSA